jgi:hypothetical protein
LQFGKKDLSEELRRLFVRKTKAVLSAENNANKLKRQNLLSAETVEKVPRMISGNI